MPRIQEKTAHSILEVFTIQKVNTREYNAN